MMLVLTNMSKVKLAFSALEVANGIGDREHLGFLDTSPEVYPFLGVEFLIAKVTEVLCTQ